jgi:glycogen synthase
MQRTQLLMTADTVGGVWTYTLELVQALAPWRCDVTLATMGGLLTPGQAREAARIPHLTVCQSNYKLEWMDNPWDEVDEAGSWLLALAAQSKPQLVHLNTFAHGALPWSVPVVMVGHSCVLSWWQAVKHEPAPPHYETYRQRVRLGLQSADLVVAPSYALLSALAHQYGPFAASQVIYNGRSLPPLKRAAKEPLIFAMGRLWDEAKNVQALEAIGDRVQWPIYVAGQAQHPAGGQQCFERVQSLGRLTADQVAHWLSRASIYALPARYEPFGLSILEAALGGCALVLGDIPSLREIWADAALYVDPEAPEALATTLNRLAADETLCAALGTAAWKRAQRYRPAAMGEEYWQLYSRLRASALPPSTQPSIRSWLHLKLNQQGYGHTIAAR